MLGNVQMDFINLFLHVVLCFTQRVSAYICMESVNEGNKAILVS